MDLGLKNKVGIVLASSKGLGKASALALAREGCNLALCARGGEALKNTADEIRKETGVAVFTRQLDVQNREMMRGFIQEVLEEYGAIHVLVTNSGGPPPGTSRSLGDEEWDEAVHSTLMVAINWSRAISPQMVKQEWGRIVHITSISVKQPIDGLILSNTMRVGVVGYAKSVSRELAPHNILVNTVCPGSYHTDRLKSLAETRAKAVGSTAEEAFKHMAADIPLGRIGDPQEMGDVVAFLASERASYLTGATIQVDGGVYRGMM